LNIHNDRKKILDFVWKLCFWLEKKLGYNIFVERLCSAITYFCLSSRHKQLLACDELVVVTAWMPAYIGNIIEVIIDLKNKGKKVVIFPEWRKSSEPHFNEEMDRYSDVLVVYDAHRCLPKVQSSIFLSSTATKHYYFSNTKNRFFYFHSVAGLDGFPDGGMDDYTDYLCATKQQYKELSDRFTGVSVPKGIHAVGYPKFDKIIRRIKNKKETDCKGIGFKNDKTVLIAPSFASEDVYQDVSMLPQIDKIIDVFLTTGWNVVFRPHPVSLRRGGFVEQIQMLKEHYQDNAHFIFDESQDYFDIYYHSKIMVTDVSGTSMMFRVAFNKPVIFYSPNCSGAVDALNIIPNIGKLTDDIGQLMKLAGGADYITEEAMKDGVYYPGHSVEKITNLLCTRGR